MKTHSAIGCLVVAASVLGACGAAGPDRITEVPLTPGDEEAPAYAGWIAVAADAERTLLVHDGGDPVRPARWTAAQPDGRIAWTRDHACPDDVDGEPWIETMAGRAVCKTRHAIVGVDLATGAEAWRWESEARLFVTARAGDRVITSAGNEVLVVLDPRDGRVLRRVVLDGAVPEAGAVAGDEPIALVVDQMNEDPKALLAQPVGGRAAAGADPEPMSPRWRVPFDAFDRHVAPSEDTVKTRPREGIEVSRALDDGAFQWLDFLDIRPPVAWGPQAGIAAVRRPEGSWVAAVDPLERTVRWQRPWPYPGGIESADQAEGRALVVGEDGWMLYRAEDGAALAGRPLEAGEGLAAAGASEQAVTWVTALGERHRIHHGPLEVGAAATAPPETPARPDWLRPGVRLVYGLVVHQGRDPETGYFREGQATHFVVDVESLEDGLTYAWQSGDGREGRRVVPEEVLASSRRHSDLYAANEGTRKLDHTSIWVSRAVAAELVEGAEAAFQDASAVGVESLRPVGDAYHRAMFIPAGEQTGPPRDLPAILARGDARGAAYWIAPWADHPLIVRAERPGFLVYLAAVQQAAGAVEEPGEQPVEDVEKSEPPPL
ncbi:MAG: hypothetical protein ACQEXJ_23000 [Myxococcota bacterium]